LRTGRSLSSPNAVAGTGHLGRLPVVGKLALGRLERAFIDEPLGTQPVERDIDLARLLHRRFRREDVVTDAEQREIAADHVHHRGDGLLAEQVEPFALGRADIARAIFLGEHLADRDQIVAGVEAVGDLDRFPERLAVAQMRRAGERLHLRAGIVDIIFAGDGIAGIFEQLRQRVADHRAAAMTHMHRPGRVGRDIFDIDPLARADGQPTIVGAARQDGGEFAAQGRFGQPDVDEAGAGDFRTGNLGQIAQARHDQVGERTRIATGGLGQDHRDIGRQIAMRRIARRLDRDIPSIEPGRQRAGGFEIVEDGADAFGKAGIERGQDGFRSRLRGAPLADRGPDRQQRG
jgi:hypothetical protein